MWRAPLQKLPEQVPEQAIGNRQRLHSWELGNSVGSVAFGILLVAMPISEMSIWTPQGLTFASLMFARPLAFQYVYMYIYIHIYIYMLWQSCVIYQAPPTGISPKLMMALMLSTGLLAVMAAGACRAQELSTPALLRTVRGRAGSG